MSKFINSLLIALLILFGTVGPATAEQLKTITLDVDGMTCPVCPITVKKALNKVDGVKTADSVYRGEGVGSATVTYDADKTNVAALTKATEDAGYPSHPRKASQ